MAAKLNRDMVSFESKPVEVTPDHYFEGPHMIKRAGRYYLMFSEGKAIDATYKVGYATGNSPLGPFTPGVNSPVLFTSSDSTTYGPGHHTVFNEKGQDYILYHRIYPQKEKYVLRQLCIDSLNFDASGNIKTIVPKGVYNFTKE
jgi:beta-xylosidase